MTKIHGIAYLIIGGTVAGMSYYLNNKYDTNSFILFFYVGLLFVAVGILKLIFKAIQNRNMKEKHPHHESHSHHAKFCSHCGSTMHSQAMYCARCGNASYSLR